MHLVRAHDFYLLAVILLVELARRVPFLPLHRWFAPLLTALAYHTSRHKRAEIKKNLARAFGTMLDAAAQQALCYQIFTAFWLEMFTWALPDSHFTQNTTILGIEHLQNALSRNKGVILWESSGFGKRVAAQAIFYVNGFALTPVHALRHLGGIDSGDTRDSQVFSKIIRPYFHNLELARVAEIQYLPQDASLVFTRTLLDRLAHNAILCIAADGPKGHKHVELPFLGQPHKFATGMLSLAQLSDAPMLPMFCTPNAAGGYILEILPPLPLSAASTRAQQQAALAQYVHLFESRIRAQPEWYRHWDLVDPNRPRLAN